MADQQWTSLHVFLPPEHLERALTVLTEQGFPTIITYVDPDGQALIREAHYGGGRGDRELAEVRERERRRAHDASKEGPDGYTTYSRSAGERFRPSGADLPPDVAIEAGEAMPAGSLLQIRNGKAWKWQP